MSSLVWRLDRTRVHALHALGPIASSLAGDRSRRVAWTLGIAAVTSLALALVAPLWMLALAPVVWGVPHLVSDVRYLVVRPGWHRRPKTLAVAGGLLLVATLTFGVTAALAAAAIATLLVLDGTRWRRLAIAAPLFAFAALTFHARLLSDAVFVQVHNLIALVLWWRWRPRDGRATAALAFAGAATLLLLGGGFDAALAHTRWTSPFHGLRLGALAAAVAPGLAARWARRLVVLYAFGQSLHYAVWLRMVPDDDRPQPTPRTFAATFRALRSDLGPLLLVVAAALAVLLVVGATFDGAQALATYLRWSALHGYVEIVALALSLARGTSPAASVAPVA
jgi:hypothetical protein